MCQKKNLQAKKIAEFVSGKLEGDPDKNIQGISGFENCGPEQLTFVENSKLFNKIDGTRAGLVLVPEEIKKSKNDIIRVKNPRLSFARVAQLFAPRPYDKPGISSQAEIDNSAVIGENAAIHSGVIIAENVVIGDRVILGPGVYIGSGVQIGNDCLIHPRVIIESNSRLGKNVIIQAGSVIGSDGYGYVTTAEGSHQKMPQLGNVEIGDDVEIGANACVDRGTTGATVIGKGTKVDNLVQIAHNVQIGKNCLIVAQVGIAGSTVIGDNVTLAGKVGVVDHVEIGDRAVVGGLSKVTKNLSGGEIYSGIPARKHRTELKEQALVKKLPSLIKKFKKMEKIDKGD